MLLADNDKATGLQDIVYSMKEYIVPCAVHREAF